MAFQTTLPTGGQLHIENRGDQTSLRFQSEGAGQQQSQQSGFSSGAWTHPPTLFQTPGGLILRVEGERNLYLSVESGSARTLTDAPDLRDAKVLPLEQVADANEMTPMKPLEPLKPLEPMKPMAPMKPMEIKMGSMHMSMGGNSPAHEAPFSNASSSRDERANSSQLAKPTETRASFCPNCGQQAQEGDRFCAKCGHELRVL